MDDIGDRILGRLPNPLVMLDGTPVCTAQDWKRKRRELLEVSIPLAYGGLPPEPEVFSVEPLHVVGENRFNSYRIVTGTAEKSLAFELQMQIPAGAGSHPVILTGDGCFLYCDDTVVRDAINRGYIVAKFNRTALASDVFSREREFGLYPVYPQLKFGAIAAWAWGYHRCVDALETLEFVDSNNIAITGHSRGGKATLLAAATDERIRFAQANCAGAAGSGCFRYEQNEAPEKGVEDHRCEHLADMIDQVPYWLGEGMEDYIGRENELPFDMHFLKAAIAPRWFLQTDTLDDIWSNPRGTYHTYCAAQEVYRFLGVEDHIAAVFRYGKHYHMLQDFRVFFDFIDDARAGRPFLQNNAEKAFHLQPIYDWTGKKPTDV